ncbi:putative GNAT family acetyltransferase [Mucilaginibacter lappiensis]|uniref:GNAT family acetyltransferase n=1 Tax=Mucilaginibacter lappiensis TaxID=354630 RepID=A0ABR6PJP8_9SPHI|nr:GNAT family N-acetyltransferase [Mucilaginibacter lappiensis]MBB6109828.1 putative GNAT family acetyltransferase [Mucilaginibacter lappiensis]
MEHLLDNPIWNALISGNNNLAYGNSQVKYFAQNVAPFVGFENYSVANFNTLHDLVTEQRVLAVVSAEEITIPAQWKVLNNMKILQMVFDGPIPPETLNHELITLQDQHIPAMLSLTKMTNPGPFTERTIDFGNYKGIFHNDELIAMAGYRTQPSPYIEVSAVCTHPSYHGKGYAGTLINYHIRQIIAASGIPYLHSRTDNATAIKLYQKLGFVARKEMTFNIIQKN